MTTTEIVSTVCFCFGIVNTIISFAKNLAKQTTNQQTNWENTILYLCATLWCLAYILK